MVDPVHLRAVCASSATITPFPTVAGLPFYGLRQAHARAPPPGFPTR